MLVLVAGVSLGNSPARAGPVAAAGAGQLLWEPGLAVSPSSFLAVTSFVPDDHHLRTSVTGSNRSGLKSGFRVRRVPRRDRTAEAWARPKVTRPDGPPPRTGDVGARSESQHRRQVLKTPPPRARPSRRPMYLLRTAPTWGRSSRLRWVGETADDCGRSASQPQHHVGEQHREGDGDGIKHMYERR